MGLLFPTSPWPGDRVIGAARIVEVRFVYLKQPLCYLSCNSQMAVLMSKSYSQSNSCAVLATVRWKTLHVPHRGPLVAARGVMMARAVYSGAVPRRVAAFLSVSPVCAGLRSSYLGGPVALNLVHIEASAPDDAALLGSVLPALTGP